ncbi:hypothetical protein GQ54DRAFT_307806 [Martensiomyces pterosporus]|nr:hypothetical protein GQ54DRAFT_307806 [Martensiomyces pterosporus]
MDVAELREAMLTIVRSHKAAAASPSFAPSSTFTSVSAVAATQSASAECAVRDTDNAMRIAVPAVPSPLQAKKRFKSDPGAPAAQRMGIDLLLNASTLSDKLDHEKPASRSYQQLPSPPAHSKRTSSLIHLSPLVEDDWAGNRELPSLPPISQLAKCRSAESFASASPPLEHHANRNPPKSATAAPADASFSTGSPPAASLSAYKIDSKPAKPNALAHPATNAYSHSFPPPLSATRSQPGISHHPSPPESQHSSPTGPVPSQGPSCASSPTGVLQVSSAPMLPPTGETISYAEHYHRRGYPTSPLAPSPMAYAQHPLQHPPQHPPQYPPQSQPPPFSFQAQAYYGQHNHHRQQQPQQPPISPRNHHAIPPPHPHPHPHPQQQQPMMPAMATSVVGVAVVRNTSKPKFNYAFMDTKRPRGPSSRWSPEEDELLKRAVAQFGEDRQWVKVAQQVPGRTNLQCRQRWLCNIKAQVDKERSAAKQ